MITTSRRLVVLILFGLVLVVPTTAFLVEGAS